jgi:endonuclease III
MPSATQKQKLLNRLYALKKDLQVADAPERPVFEQMVYAVCREGASAADADRAYENLRAQFFDWNEIRVSTVREVSVALSHLPLPLERSKRIISFLQEVFETAYAFSLDNMQKKGLKLAEKQLERFQAANAFAVAYVLQHSLGGHSLPLDGDMRRTLCRLEMIDDDTTPAAAQSSLEHLIPKAKGIHFCETVSALAHQFCHEETPRCTACPMQSMCPAAREFTTSASGGGVAVKTKGR